MKLIYIYHSCYVIEEDNFTLIIDFYKDTLTVKKGLLHNNLPDYPGKLYVLSSHSHPDHFNPEILAWKKIRPDIQYIFSKDILDAGFTKTSDAVYLDKADKYKDELLQIKAFGSTDLGISFLIKTGGKKIFHAGDLNNWHWNEESTSEESKEYELNYLNELELLAKENEFLDVVMFPVDPRLGKDYMRGAEQFVDRIRTGLFAPMHFRENYNAALAFKSYAESKGCRFAAWKEKGDSCLI